MREITIFVCVKCLGNVAESTEPGWNVGDPPPVVFFGPNCLHAYHLACAIMACNAENREYLQFSNRRPLGIYRDERFQCVGYNCSELIHRPSMRQGIPQIAYLSIQVQIRNPNPGVVALAPYIQPAVSEEEFYKKARPSTYNPEDEKLTGGQFSLTPSHQPPSSWTQPSKKKTKLQVPPTHTTTPLNLSSIDDGSETAKASPTYEKIYSNCSKSVPMVWANKYEGPVNSQAEFTRHQPAYNSQPYDPHKKSIPSNSVCRVIPNPSSSTETGSGRSDQPLFREYNNVSLCGTNDGSSISGNIENIGDIITEGVDKPINELEQESINENSDLSDVESHDTVMLRQINQKVTDLMNTNSPQVLPPVISQEREMESFSDEEQESSPEEKHLQNNKMDEN